MDSVTSYRAKIMNLLGEFAALVTRTTRYKDVDTVCLFDEARDNYMVYRIGWDQNKRIRTTMLFMRVIDGKIWIEENSTEIDVLQELLQAGVPKEDICFGFLHPLMRDEAETTAVA